MQRTYIIFVLFCLCATIALAQNHQVDESKSYKKRVLEVAELELLFSYYEQDGSNAAVTGGVGTEALNDITPTIVYTVPLSDDNVLSFEAGVSAYTSASSSNLNPFDGGSSPDPFAASSGASQSDQLIRLNTTFSHSSDDRNRVWNMTLSLSNEYDYTSFGLSGGLTKIFNEGNTQLNLSGSTFFDKWNPQYPIELRAFANGGSAGEEDEDEGDEILFDLNKATITGNTDYNPIFSFFQNKSRNSYAVGMGISQILSPRLQVSFSADLMAQQGLLSSPMQRVYFADREDSFVDGFQLADAIELLPDSRFKIALGNHTNYYVNERIVLKYYLRLYTDNWGVNSITTSLKVPIKLFDSFSIYPKYRYYTQSDAEYFSPFEENLSTQKFYTSDFDLSKFQSHQYGVGFSYNPVFPFLSIKNIYLEYNHYSRRKSELKADIISFGMKFSL